MDYATALETFEEYRRGLSSTGMAPERIGSVVWQALSTRRPQARYTVLPGRLWKAGIGQAIAIALARLGHEVVVIRPRRGQG